ncbi:MFS transporter [Alicyclobacillus ferrooxydans]|uniref:MFS transporter n=1 Tax=Alicyclobacillus ferrooxydans TaxID=471514 RepID=UPI0006D578E7|nr:MFS transporter [Alicyclobacillus ferrooxydans]
MTLRKNHDFLRLWIGQSVSEIGSRISREGIPMGAVLMMGITPLTMSGLSLATQLPASILGLFVGVWVDRLARRPLMIAADLIRAALLILIPAATLAGILHLWMFFVVAALSGILTLLFDVSYQAYLPWLIDRSNLAEGNTKLGITGSAAEVIGPGLAGILVQALTVPFAILFDALSYLFSAMMLWRIGKRETENGRLAGEAPGNRCGTGEGSRNCRGAGEGEGSRNGCGTGEGEGSNVQLVSDDEVLNGPSWHKELMEGLRAVRNNRILLAFAGVTATMGFASSAMFVLDTLYALKNLGLSPLLFGLTVTMGGVGSLIGAAIANRMTRALGIGPTLLLTLFLNGFAGVFWVMAGGSVWRSTLLLLAAQLLGDTSGMVYSILETTVRQTLVPDALLGRVNATIRVMDVGLTAIGSLVAGIFGEWFGIRDVMIFAVIGMVLTTLWLVLSPVRRLRSVQDTQLRRP